jgi:hypothetical protein
MRSVALLATIVMLNAGHLFGDEFFSAEHNLYLDHLVPVRSFMADSNDEYDQSLAEHLFVTEGTLGRMLFRSSFSPEYCLSVDVEHAEHPAEKDEPTTPSGDPFASTLFRSEKSGLQVVSYGQNRKEDRYRITVTTAAKRIYGALGKKDKNGGPVRVRIERVDREISRDLAVAIQRVWAKALLRTRYPAPIKYGPIGLDGTIYQFSVFVRGFGTLAGEMWSPREGLPNELTKVGGDLVSFARQDEKGKKMAEKQLIDRLRKLEATIPEK